MTLKYFIVDVFAEEKYQGNQLAVFMDTAKLTTEEMQSIALETNFAETTFIESSEKVKGGYNVRIFTPDTEVPFAGHPTLGTAFILSNYIEPKNNHLLMNYKVGQIPVTIAEDNTLFMTQVQPEFLGTISKTETSGILGIENHDIMDFPIQQVSTGLPFYIVPLKSLASLRKVAVNTPKYRALMNRSTEQEITPAFLSFCKEPYGEDHDLCCRMHYMENNQIVEDSATGSANGCLLSYLLKYSILESKQLELKVEQGYEINRPSLIYHKGELSEENYSIKIGGKVQLISEGSWYHED